MKRQFYYAEIDLTAELKQSQDGFLDGLSINEFNALSVCIHSAITDFLLVRALLAADTMETLEQVKKGIHLDKPDTHGG